MIINWLYIALIVLTVLSIILMTWILSVDFEAGMGFGLLAILFVGVIGWGALGHSVSASNFTQELKGLALKTDNSIIVAVDGVPKITLTDITNYKKFTNNEYAAVIQDGYADIYSNIYWKNSYHVK